MSFNIVDFDRHIKKFPVTWTPAKLDTILWLDAADEGSLTPFTNEFGQISQWTDKSTLGTNHAIMPVEASRPAYTVDAKPSGRRAVRFTSSGGTYMTADSVVNSLNSGSYEAYMVVRFDLLDVVQRVFRSAADLPSFASEEFAWGGSDFQYAGTGLTGDPNVFELGSFFGSYPVAGQPSLFRMAYDRLSGTYGSMNMTANGYIGFEDVLALRGDKGNYLTFTLSSPSAGLTGFLYEIVFFSSVLNDSNRRRAEGYLAHKWGIAGNLPGGHPYKLKSPRD